MEIREFAEQIFFGHSVADKLIAPEGGIRALTDREPGQEVAWQEPGRAPDIAIAWDVKHRRLPRPGALQEERHRIRCLHAFANHELMALEMMAWALLAFPDAPPAFRLGLVKVVEDEQRHFRLYKERIEEMGVCFGDIPLNAHFWRVAGTITSPLRWVCAMHLTFEQANLDHAPFYGKCFGEAGDEASAALMQHIFEDEIMHVRFGGHWLRKYKRDDQTAFEAFQENLAINNPMHRAKGTHFNTEARRLAGLDDAFIEGVRLHKRDPSWRPEPDTRESSKPGSSSPSSS